MKILYFILVIFAAMVPCEHALHMFQQNRYELGRYTNWIEDNVEGGIRRAILPSVVILIFAFACMKIETSTILIMCIAISALLSIYLFYREHKASYIKPLVYTGRVKRQIIVMALLYLIFQSFLLAKYRRFNLWWMLANSYFLPWILIYPMALITSPIENIVKQRFITEAKNILKEHTGMKIIGITGSYGKTSTKNVVGAILSEQWNTLITPASYNTPMGITRTIREYLKPIHEIFVCEMGADHVGDIEDLMNFVEPSVGIVTSIGPQHLATFKTQDNIIREKMLMIEKLPKDGLGILNYDNEYIRNYNITNPVKILTYGIRNSKVDYFAKDISYSMNGSHFTLVHENEEISFETKLLGELNILNILSAIIVARYFGEDWQHIQRAVKQMKQIEHRLEQKRIHGRMFIDDAFNANPAGAHMALEVLSLMEGKRFIITPGMIDLGTQQEKQNRAFGADMKGKVDEVILVGERQTASIYEGLKLSGFDMNCVQVVDKVQEAFQYVYAHATSKDTILLENDLPDAFNK